MGLGNDLSKFIPKDFGKKKKGISKQSNAIETPRTDPSSELAEPTKANVIELHDERKQSTVADLDIPISKHVLLKRHTKAVSALAWDATGDSLISGEHGPSINLWDFPTMDHTFQPFGTIVPYEGQQTRALKYNSSGTHFICATSAPRAKLYTRMGRMAGECKSGDMYVMDMRRTNGHVSGLTCVDWDPRSDSRFVTAAGDSTLRFWDMERMVQEQVVVAKTKTRGKVAVTACVFNKSGSMVVSAQCGGISVWPSKGPFVRPVQHVDDAHAPMSDVCVALVPASEHLFVSRGDATVKLWDVRNLKTEVAVAERLPGSESSVAFSPDGKALVVGLGSQNATPNTEATVTVLDSTTLNEHRRISLQEPGDVLSIVWHSTLNQIACGLSTGSIAITYDPSQSTRGAMLGITKRSRQYVANTSTGPIITPHALPLFREDRPVSTKRRHDKDRNDPVRSHKPSMPVRGHGRGGVVGVNETQHIMKSIMKDTMRDEDPREALLRYAKVAENDPKFITPLYKETQGKPVFSEEVDEPETKRRK
ncbi:hypothetical protein GGH12_004475 [Coemansia sp. RSA 1822]|nr:hypothetical protein LPJ76_004441 [Coemansia sp. RSA 638]KAJ2540683.1 hypothetical protein GGF49_004253 [Coemansia sp. RSA 1853]KAJ2560826.1 hypothetical protein GGH12_004475 [Coemansia sp. RSA 1822]